MLHDTSSWCTQEQNTITSKSCSKWAEPETHFFILMWIMAMLKMTCHPYCKFRKNSNSRFSTFHFLSTLRRTCPSDYSKASSYLQFPQSQQTSEGPGLHRTYQIIPQVPEGKEREREEEKERYLASISIHLLNTLAQDSSIRNEAKEMSCLERFEIKRKLGNDRTLLL